MRASLRAAPDRGRRLLLINAAFGRPELLFAPFGLLRLSAAIHHRCRDVDSRVVVCNSADEHDHERGIDTYLDEFQPAMVGISALSAAMPWALELVARVRRYHPAVPVILGGFHATSYPDGIGKYDFDYFVRGEGTRSGPALVNFLLDGVPERESIHGLSYRDDRGASVHTPAVEPSLDLDDNPPICWSDLDTSLFTERLSSSVVGPHVRVRFPEPFISHTVSQGCPRRCGFCERISGDRLRRHSPERIVADVRELHARLGSTWVSLGDDTINFDREWLISLLRALSKGPPLRYSAGVNGDRLDREIIDRMIDAGFGIILCFPEAGSERVRGVLGKKIAMGRLLENMEYANSRGAVIAATFILGAPGETLAEAGETLALAREPVFDLVGFNQLILYGTTALGRHLADIGIEPDTPEYFAYLHAPAHSCVADYGTEDLIRQSIIGKRLSLEKAADPRVIAKLDRWGLEVNLDLMPRLEEAHESAQSDDSSPAEIESGPVEVSEEEETEEEAALPAACADLVAALGAPDFEPISACLEPQPGGEPALRVRMHSPAGELTLWISSRDVPSYFRRTQYFALSYQGRDLSRAMERLLIGVLERLVGWEANNEYRDQVCALMSPS